MLRYYLILALPVLALTPTSRASQNGDPFETLREGMERHSDSLMIQFFESWFKASGPLRKEPVTDLQKEAEAVVETMWNPVNHHTLLWGWTADSIIPPAFPPYIVLGSSVQIFTDSSKSFPIDSLESMFPCKLFGAKTLIVNKNNKQYQDSINRDIRRMRREDHEITNYLSKFVSISRGMAGSFAVLQPSISSISLLDNCKTAVVSYWMANQGCDGTLHKVNGKWQIIKREMKWIE
jgi:hypothetical protein